MIFSKAYDLSEDQYRHIREMLYELGPHHIFSGNDTQGSVDIFHFNGSTLGFYKTKKEIFLLQVDSEVKEGVDGTASKLEKLTGNKLVERKWQEINIL